MELVERREEVRWLWGHFLVSQRRVCELLNVAESSCRYRRRRNDEELRERLVAAAREKPRWGYRRLHIVLQQNGCKMNHKRVYRVYREAGLTIRRKRRKRLLRAGFARAAVNGPNQEWALDFVHDAAASGRKFRVLSVIDVYTRECLALEVDTSFASRRVTRVLEQIVAERGVPVAIRCDNGPELTSRHFLAWCLGAEDRAGAHRAGAADAERTCGEFSREAAGRVPERQLVRKFVGRAAEDRRVEGRVQRGEAAQQPGVCGAARVCPTNCGAPVAYGSLRAAIRPTAGGRSYAARRFRCRMIPCAEPGGIYGPIPCARAFEVQRVKNETHAYIRPLTAEEWVTPRAQMESALLLLISSSACYGPAPFRF
jgi:hypothetical protein